MPTYDTNGFIEFSIHPSSVTYYVSSSSGNDSNNGLSEEFPLQTIFAATNKMINNTQIIVKLKCGDIWSNNGIMPAATGLSPQYPSIITTYGTGSRPLIQTGINAGIKVNSGTTVNNIAFIGLHFEARQAGPTTTASGAVRWIGSGTFIYFEDCVFRKYAEGIILQATPLGSINDVTIRRCIINDNYNTGGGTVGQGIYAEGVDNLTVEECTLDRNGWHPTYSNVRAITLHNVYIHHSTTGVVFKNNYSLRGAATGAQLRTGGICERNVFAQNAIGLTFGEVNGGGSTVPGGVEGHVKENVVLEGQDLLNVGDVPRGHGIDIANTKSTIDFVVDNNIIAHTRSEYAYGQAFFLPILHGDDVHKITLSNNLVYKWDNPLLVTCGSTINPPLQSIKLINNIFQHSGQLTPLMTFKSFVAPTDLATFRNSFFNSLTSSSNNTFHKASSSQDILFRSQLEGTQLLINITEYKTRANDTTTTSVAKTFSNPNRTTGTYAALITGDPSQNTIDDLSSLLINRNLKVWPENLKTTTFINYVRSGFDLLALDEPVDPPTENLIAPVITLLGSNPMTINYGTPFVDPGATAIDDVDGDISESIIVTGTVNNSLVGAYTLTYTVTDSSDNVSYLTRTVNIVDNVAPVITLLGANPQTIEVKTSYIELGATATDNYNTNLTSQIIKNSINVDINTIGSYIVTYTVSDSSGNTTTINRTVNVVDTTSPVITLGGANPLEVAVGSLYSDPSGTISIDNYDGNISNNIVVNTSSLNTNVIGDYNVTYTSTDSSGNVSTKTRTIQVRDKVKPVITLNGNNPLIIEAGTSYVEPGVLSAIDNYDGNITSQVIIDSLSVNTDVPNDYLVSYKSTDSSGNFRIVYRTVRVLESHPPVITLTGDTEITLEYGQTYIEEGYICNDPYEGNLTSQVVVTDSVNYNVLGTYTITYYIIDSVGHEDLKTRTITIVDNISPHIVLKGPNPQTISVGSQYFEYGVQSATDNYNGDLKNNVIIDSSQLNNNVLGNYIVTYSVSDSSGNSVQVNRTVNVVDLVPPVLVLNELEMEIEAGDSFIDPGITSAIDNYDGDVSHLVIVDSSNLDTNKKGTYSVTYTVSDSSGNISVQNLTVNVIDSTAPLLELIGENPFHVQAGTSYVDPGYTAIDISDGDISNLVQVDFSTIDTGTIGTYVVSYTVSDSSGNTTSTTRTVIVEDTNRPVITLKGTNPYKVAQHSVYVDPGAIAIDSFEGDISESIVIDSSNVDTSIPGEFIVTYNVADSSGNEAIEVIRNVSVFTPLRNKEYNTSKYAKEIGITVFLE